MKKYITKPFMKKAEKELKTEERTGKVKRGKKKKVIASCFDYLPIRKYDERLDCFVIKDNRYLDIVKILPRDIANMSEDDINRNIYYLIKAYKTIGDDLKFISMNFPLDTSTQREFLERKLEKGNNVQKKWLNRQINELFLSETGVDTRQFFLMYFSENEEKLLKSRRNILDAFSNSNFRLAEEISRLEKVNVIKKLNNMNTQISIFEEEEIAPDITDYRKEELDKNLFEVIQPRGGISFSKSSYARSGDGFSRCIRIYALPTYINEFWIEDLFNFQSTICTFDMSTKDLKIIKENINKSISEERSREMAARNHEEYYNANKKKNELENLFDEVSRLGEVIKLVDFRIFISCKTLTELEEKTAEILASLESSSYKGTLMLNEQKREFESLFEKSIESHEKAFSMKGLNLTATQLAMGFPFNYSDLLDEKGTLLGFSKTGGAVLYNPFTKTSKRKYYNSLITGDMGSGKSTLLKKLLKTAASYGDIIRVFDVSGEFQYLIEEFGGKIINCSGREGMLNPLEILKSGDDEKISYANHITKLQTFFLTISPELKGEGKTSLANFLKSFYEIYGLDPDRKEKITGLPAEKYPTLSNFKSYLENCLLKIKELDKHAETDVETNLNVDSARTISSILNTVSNLINNYKSVFDGVTTIDDISKEQIVCFDISAIKDLGDVFKAQMQILVALCWDNAVSNGSKMKRLWESTPQEERNNLDIVNTLVLIDESHRWVNTSNPLILDMIARYEREARKYFAGIALASQSIRDFMPEAGENIDKIKTLFELSQYKFMFKQDSSVKELLKNHFSFSLTLNQIDKIPFLEQGETILSISGDKSIEFKVWLSKDYEETLFAGGK